MATSTVEASPSLLSPPPFLYATVPSNEHNTTLYSIKKETTEEAFWNEVKDCVRATLRDGTLLCLSLSPALCMLIAIVAIDQILLFMAAVAAINIVSKQIWNGELYQSFDNWLDSIKWLEPSENRKYNNLVKQLEHYQSQKLDHSQKAALYEIRAAQYIQKLDALNNDNIPPSQASTAANADQEIANNSTPVPQAT